MNILKADIFNCTQWHPHPIFSDQRDSILAAVRRESERTCQLKRIARPLAFIRYTVCAWLTPFSSIIRKYLFLADPERRFCAFICRGGQSLYG